MIRFFKEAIRELRHVVWPTRKETQKFFGGVLALIIIFTLYLFIFTNIFSTIIFGMRDLFRGAPQESSIDVSDIFIDENQGEGTQVLPENQLLPEEEVPVIDEEQQEGDVEVQQWEETVQEEIQEEADSWEQTEDPEEEVQQ